MIDITVSIRGSLEKVLEIVEALNTRAGVTNAHLDGDDDEYTATFCVVVESVWYTLHLIEQAGLVFEIAGFPVPAPVYSPRLTPPGAPRKKR
jgi:hypothetical protein